MTAKSQKEQLTYIFETAVKELKSLAERYPENDNPTAYIQFSLIDAQYIIEALKKHKKPGHDIDYGVIKIKERTGNIDNHI